MTVISPELNKQLTDKSLELSGSCLLVQFINLFFFPSLCVLGYNEGLAGELGVGGL